MAKTSETQYFYVEWMPEIRVFVFPGSSHISDILGGFRLLLTIESSLEVSLLPSCCYSLMIWAGHFYTEIFLEYLSIETSNSGKRKHSSQIN